MKTLLKIIFFPITLLIWIFKSLGKLLKFMDKAYKGIKRTL